MALSDAEKTVAEDGEKSVAEAGETTEVDKIDNGESVDLKEDTETEKEKKGDEEDPVGGSEDIGAEPKNGKDEEEVTQENEKEDEDFLHQPLFVCCCGASFRFLGQITSHKKKACEWIYVCPHCDRVYKDFDKMEAHKKTHATTSVTEWAKAIVTEPLKEAAKADSSAPSGGDKPAEKKPDEETKPITKVERVVPKKTIVINPPPIVRPKGPNFPNGGYMGNRPNFMPNQGMMNPGFQGGFNQGMGMMNPQMGMMNQMGNCGPMNMGMGMGNFGPNMNGPMGGMNMGMNMGMGMGNFGPNMMGNMNMGMNMGNFGPNMCGNFPMGMNQMGPMGMNQGGPMGVNPGGPNPGGNMGTGPKMGPNVGAAQRKPVGPRPAGPNDRALSPPGRRSTSPRRRSSRSPSRRDSYSDYSRRDSPRDRSRDGDDMYRREDDRPDRPDRPSPWAQRSMTREEFLSTRDNAFSKYGNNTEDDDAPWDPKDYRRDSNQRDRREDSFSRDYRGDDGPPGLDKYGISGGSYKRENPDPLSKHPAKMLRPF